MYQYPKQDIDVLEIIAMFRSRGINDSMGFLVLWNLLVILRICFKKELNIYGKCGTAVQSLSVRNRGEV